MSDDLDSLEAPACPRCLEALESRGDVREVIDPLTAAWVNSCELPDRRLMPSTWKAPHRSRDGAFTVGARLAARDRAHEIGHFYGLDDERLHELGWA